MLTQKYIRKIFELLLLTLIFCIIFGFNIKLSDVFLLPKQFLLSLNLLIITILIISNNLLFKIKIKFYSSILYIIIIYFLLQLIICPGKINIIISIFNILLYIVSYTIYRSYSELKHNRIKLLYSIFFLLFIHTLYAFIQSFGIDFPFWEGWAGHANVFTTMGNPNASSHILLVSYCFSYFFILNSKSRIIKIGAIINLLINIYLIYIIQTRGIWIAFIVTTFIFCFYILKTIKIKKIIPAVLFSIFIILLILFSNNKFSINIKRTLHSLTGYKDGSVANRILMWKITNNIFRDNLITGCGIGNYKKLYLIYQYHIMPYVPEYLKDKATDSKHSHNDILQMLSEIGLLGTGIVIYIFLILIIFRKKLVVMPVLFITIAGQIIHSFFDFPFHLPTHSFLFILFVAIVTKNVSNVKSPPNRHRDGTFFKYNPMIYIICIIILIYFSVSIRHINADYYFNFYQKTGNKNSIQLAYNLINFDGRYSTSYAQMIGYSKSNPDRAIEIYKKTTAFFNDPVIYNDLANMYDKINKKHYAENYYKKVIRMYPMLNYSYNNYALFLMKQKKYDMAINISLQGLNYFPDNTQLINNLGRIYYYTEKFQNAKKQYLKSMKINPEQIEPYINIGAILYKTKKYNEALTFFQQGLKIEPNNDLIKRNIQNIISVINNETK